jgi:alcohol dehydrogenase (cytochrome c)
VRASAFKKITISGLATALGISAGLLMTQSSSRAQQQKEKEKEGAPVPIPLVLQNYAPVTAERLKNPADGDWLMIRRTYNGWGYSPLDQINTTNVSKLRLVWSTITGESRVHEAAPLINNGAMFVSTPNGQVIAFDAKTGDILWRYRKPRGRKALLFCTT